MDETSAATYIQSAKRGKEARAAALQKKTAAEDRAKQMAADKEAKASTALSAGARGYVQRKKQKEETQKMDQATTRIQANFRGKKERADPKAEANVRRERSKNDPQVQAAAYMKEHKLMELFEMLGQQLVREQPADARAFLVRTLEASKSKKDKTSPLNFFTDMDIDTIFDMYDVGKSSTITYAQCREALDAIGLEGVGLPADKSAFSLSDFRSLVK